MYTAKETANAAKQCEINIHLHRLRCQYHYAWCNEHSTAGRVDWWIASALILYHAHSVKQPQRFSNRELLAVSHTHTHTAVYCIRQNWVAASTAQHISSITNCHNHFRCISLEARLDSGLRNDCAWDIKLTLLHYACKNNKHYTQTSLLPTRGPLDPRGAPWTTRGPLAPGTDLRSPRIPHAETIILYLYVVVMDSWHHLL